MSAEGRRKDTIRAVAKAYRAGLSANKDAFSPYWQNSDMQRHAIDNAHEEAARLAIEALKARGWKDPTP